MNNPILAYIWGGIMAKFFTHHWEKYQLRLFHDYDDIRSYIPIIPLFWDTEVVFAFGVRPHKGIPITEQVLQYDWTLLDIEDNPIKSGRNTVQITKLGLKRFLRGYWPYGKRKGISLGYLAPNKHYKLSISLVDKNGVQSEVLPFAMFTTKDRDEIYMQVFIGVVVIFMGIIIGVFAKACSL